MKNTVLKNPLEGVKTDTWSAFGGNKLLLLVAATFIYGVLVGLLFRMRIFNWFPTQVVNFIGALGFLVILYLWAT